MHVTLPDADYRQLEAFITRTPRGRAFLGEHARRARMLGMEEVQGILHSIQEAWQKQEAAASVARHVEVLRRELQDMSASIVQARREIAAIRPKDGSDRITTAANELDAILLSTERASIEILGSAERIQETADMLKRAGAPDALIAVLNHEVTSIFTACSFQDLTGQRTTKVVNALRYIEQRILTLMDLWGVEGIKLEELPSEPADARPDAHLLHGPSDDGVDQDDVDRLLNGEDAAPRPAKAPAAAAARPAAKPAAEEEEIVPLDQSSIDALFG